MKTRLIVTACLLASVLCASGATIPQKRGFLLAPRPEPHEAGNVVVNAGPDQVITNSLQFSLNGNVSGGWSKAFRLTWLQLSGPASTIHTPANFSTLVTATVDGNYTYLLVGTDGVLYRADGVTVIVNVSAPNTAPTVTTPASQNGFEETALGPVALTVDDAETAPGSLQVTGFSSDASIVPASGIAFGGSGASRTITITPAPNQNGAVTITLLVGDGTATTSTSFSATFAAVNDAPTISQSSPQSTPEDVVKVVSFTVGDQETAAGSLTLAKSSNNQTVAPDADIVLGGSGANRTATITPGLNQTGSATITIIVSDGSLTATNAFLFVVGAVNDPPTISSIANQAVNEDTPTSALAFTISDLETAAGTLAVSGNSTNLALLPTANIAFGGSGGSRTVTLTPVANQNGVSTVTISVSDGTNSASTAFTFTVNAINDPPTISALANQSVVEPASTGALPFTVGDLETAVGSLTVSGASGDTILVPTANIVFGGSGANRTVTVTPAAGQTGSTTITVTVNDGTTTANSAFTITSTSGNTPPTVTTPASQSGFEDTVLGPVNFTVGDGQTAPGSLVVTRESSNLSLVPLANAVLGGSGANRTITLTPASNLSGQTTITLTVTDAGGLQTSAIFTATFSAVNDFPQFTSTVGNQNVGEDSVTGPLSFGISDQETVAASLTITVSHTNTALFPSASSLLLGGSGAARNITLTPAANAFGQDQVTVTLSDGQNSIGMAFNVTVNAVNDTPTMAAIANASGTVGVATVVNFNADDVESGGILTYTRTSTDTGVVPVANITFGGSGTNRTASVTAAASGTSTLTFRGTDSGGLFAERSFTFTASSPANTPPTITNPGSQTTTEGTQKLVSVTVGDAEDGASPLTLIVVSSSNPTLLPTGNITFSGTGATRTISLTPAANQFGSTTVTVKVRDTASAETPVAFALTVSAVDDVPNIASISNQGMTEDIPINVPVSATDSDDTSLTWSAQSSNTGLVPNGGLTFLNGTALANTLRIVPTANQSGTAIITVTANDGVPTLASNTKIWDTAAHNAFTGLEYYAGKFVLAFREASTHLSLDGTLRVLTSTDGVTWASASTISLGGADLRDPHLSTARNGLLRLNCMSRVDASGVLQSRAYFSSDGITWSSPAAVSEINYWLWSMTPGPDADYSIGYSVNSSPRIKLYRSTDSTNFTSVNSGMQLSASSSSESSMLFRSSGQAVALLRRDDLTSGGLSSSPYSAWTWSSLTTDLLGGPEIIETSDGRIIGGTRLTRFAAPAVVEMILVSPEQQFLARYLTLATSADSGYCGIVDRDGYFWVSYYSSHEGKASIYVAKVRKNLPRAFVLTVTAANDQPTVTAIADKTTALNTASGPHPFTVGDVETAAAALTVTGSSGNPALVPNANIVFTGSGANRNVTVTPASGQSGQANITLTVNDGTGGTAIETFVLTVSGGVNPEYYVATGGAFGNTGTQTSPWNMDRGFSVVSGKPEVGATVWIRGGIYDAEHDSDAPGVIYKAYQGEIPRIGPRDPEVGHTVFSLHAANVQFWRLVFDCDVKQAQAEGIYSDDNAAGNKFIFCLVKDLPQGMGIQDNRPSGGGCEVYGTVILFGGWDNSASDPGGHNGYFQNAGALFKFIKSVSAYSHSKLINSGGSAAASNKNWLIADNIFLWDGGASQAAYDLGRFVEYIAFIGNGPIENATYSRNLHVGGHLQFGYPDPLNIDVTVEDNFEVHPGFGNGTFSGMHFSKFQDLRIRRNKVDVSFDPTMDLNNSGSVSRDIDLNQYFGTLDFDPGGSFSGWQGNGYDASGSASGSHWSTLYIQYERFTDYPNEPERAHVAFWNPQSQSSISLDGAQCGLVGGDQYTILNTLHPDMTLPHKFRVATSGTYTGSSISVPISGLLVGTPKGKGSPPPNCYPKSGALLVKRTN